MTSLPSIRAVAFDLDGLMFNTEELYYRVGDALLQRRGAGFSPELQRAMMGLPSEVAYRVMIDWHGLAETPAELQVEGDALLLHEIESRLEPLPGLFSLLAALEGAGRPKGIATSSRRMLVERILAPHALAPRFTCILTREDVRHGKPDPEIYLLAAARLGCPPASLLVLEDSQTGCRAASAAGAQVVAVPGPPSRDHDFSTAHLQATSLDDPRLWAWLGLARAEA